MAPQNGKTSRDPYWDIKRSIANAIARAPNPSLLRLHHEVLEEFGYRPDLELVDYFCSIAEIAEEEIADYFHKIALPAGEEGGQEEKESGTALADRIAMGPAPTILKFRTEYESRFGAEPPEDLLRYFLKKMQEKPRNDAREGMSRDDTEFATAVAAQPGATVLRFRQEYERKYGKEPPEKLTRFFLLKKQQQAAATAAATQEQGRSAQGDGGSEQEDSKVIFARTVANGLVTTILQFRTTYEKVYKEPPSQELIEVFLKSLPRG